MPKHEPASTDPLLLVGVELPAATEDDTRAMAEAFVEEYARLGLTSDRILALFRNPAYPPCHAALRVLGEAEVRRLAEEYCKAFSREMEV